MLSATRPCNQAAAVAALSTAMFWVIRPSAMPANTSPDPAVARSGLPVLLMTGFGYDPHHSIVRASQEGLSSVLFKPFKVDQLMQEIRKALGMEEKPQAKVDKKQAQPDRGS